MTSVAAFGEPSGQGWAQIGEIAIAFGLSALIGLEREAKQKAAGIRTYTLVGTAAALFMLISKYGFTDVLSGGRVVLDPSRVAAQIVSGVGFIGGGIIFVYRDSVRGLTTAASVWLTAAVGAAAGAGLALLAAIATGGYFLAIIGLPPLGHAVTRRLGIGAPALQVRYHDGRGLLRRILATVTDAGFHVVGVDTTRQGARRPAAADHRAATTEVEVTVQIQGRASLTELVSRLTEIEGVLAVETTEGEEPY